MTSGDGETTGSQTGDVDRIWKALEGVKDPEIPAISLVELGMIPDVSVDGSRVTIRMLPTFAGCPALDVMREDLKRAVEAAGFSEVCVDVVFEPTWSTDRITPEGLRKLKAFGLAPPSKCGAGVTEAALENVCCPYCESRNTTLESMFGPTLCRAIHYCNNCLQSFEQFKPVD